MRVGVPGKHVGRWRTIIDEHLASTGTGGVIAGSNRVMAGKAGAITGERGITAGECRAAAGGCVITVVCRGTTRGKRRVAAGGYWTNSGRGNGEGQGARVAWQVLVPGFSRDDFLSRDLV